ncbi:MAG: hypothetical protein ACREOF_15725, partial [Gemmatimonadales bacterium]
LAMVDRWVGASNWTFLADPARRSPAVSALVPPAGVRVAEVLREMRARGFTLAGGLGALADRLVRIGHMGDATPATVETMLGALTDLAAGSGV